MVIISLKYIDLFLYVVRMFFTVLYLPINGDAKLTLFRDNFSFLSIFSRLPIMEVQLLPPEVIVKRLPEKIYRLLYRYSGTYAVIINRLPFK